VICSCTGFEKLNYLCWSRLLKKRFCRNAWIKKICNRNEIMFMSFCLLKLECLTNQLISWTLKYWIDLQRHYVSVWLSAEQFGLKE